MKWLLKSIFTKRVTGYVQEVVQEGRQLKLLGFMQVPCLDIVIGHYHMSRMCHLTVVNYGQRTENGFRSEVITCKVPGEPRKI